VGVTDERTEVVRKAREIAEEVLFPSALDTDRADLVPRAHLDLLAAQGFYGLAGPRDAGGFAADERTFAAVVEALAGGCLATTFVWIQHHSGVRALSSSANESLRAAFLAPLCAGEVRGGIALGGLRPSPSRLTAREVEGGWLLDGVVPFITGWRLIDVMLVAAHVPEGDRELRLLVDSAETTGLTVQHLQLVAANASSTVEATFRDFFVPSGRTVSLEPYRPPPAFDGGGRGNGSLALGVAARCSRLMRPSPLEAEIATIRDLLDRATPETMAAARAAASALALRAAARLAVHTGSSSLLSASHAQRLMREAHFLLVFGTRPAIRAELLRALGNDGP
jgi:alkylation response protein AidB-like acyl-CoA dehydrogenase